MSRKITIEVRSHHRGVDLLNPIVLMSYAMWLSIEACRWMLIGTWRALKFSTEVVAGFVARVRWQRRRNQIHLYGHSLGIGQSGDVFDDYASALPDPRPGWWGMDGEFHPTVAWSDPNSDPLGDLMRASEWGDQ
jgi:hypothetical protein